MKWPQCDITSASLGTAASGQFLKRVDINYSDFNFSPIGSATPIGSASN